MPLQSLIFQAFLITPTGRPYLSGIKVFLLTTEISRMLSEPHFPNYTHEDGAGRQELRQGIQVKSAGSNVEYTQMARWAKMAVFTSPAPALY